MQTIVPFLTLPGTSAFTPRLVLRTPGAAPRPARGAALVVEAREARPPRVEGRFANTELLRGDLIMLICTQLASDRLPMYEELPLALVCATSWFLCAGLLMGDYSESACPNANLDELSRKQGWAMFRGIMRGTVRRRRGAEHNDGAWTSSSFSCFLTLPLLSSLISSLTLSGDLVPVRAPRDRAVGPHLHLAVPEVRRVHRRCGCGLGFSRDSICRDCCGAVPVHGLLARPARDLL
jgi:hypothetical protein